jgi:transcriptional regulator with XRE-family HTH domain
MQNARNALHMVARGVHNRYMTTSSSPTVAKLTFGPLLKRIRLHSGKERPEIAEELSVDLSTYGRWESGKYAPQPGTIAALAEAIGATAEERARMKDLAESARKRGLFESRSVPPHLRALYELEAIAVRIWSLELEHIPGLLQTIDYHQRVQSFQLPAEPKYAETLRNLRQQRYKIMLSRADGPEMLFLIGESAMRYLDLHPDIKDDQLGRLREANALPNAEVRVITGMHAGMLGAFTIFEPPATTGGRPFLYTETLRGEAFEEGDVVSTFGEAARLVRDKQSQNLEDYLR